MKYIELPVVYTKNLKEIREGEETGIVVEEDNVTLPTTFIIPDGELVRINPYPDNPETTVVWFLGSNDSYQIDSGYETVRMMFGVNK